MVTFRINDIECEIKDRWSEVDCDKLKDCQNFKDELKALTTIPHEFIDKGRDTQLFPLYTLISFIDNMEAVPMCDDAVNVATSPYDDFEVAKGFLRSDCKPYRKWINVARVYYPDEKDSVRLIALGVNIVNQISIFLGKYEDMLKDPPEEDSVQAGIEELSVFGVFGTAYTLAGEDILKLEQVLKLPTIRVYTALYYNWRKDKYMKRLFDIKNPKKNKG